MLATDKNYDDSDKNRPKHSDSDSKNVFPHFC